MYAFGRKETGRSTKNERKMRMSIWTQMGDVAKIFAQIHIVL